MVACCDGDVFAFGRNDFGQLGHGDCVDKRLPELVTSLRGARVASLACGQYHTVVATREGAVLACGKNDWGQLGLAHHIEQQHAFSLLLSQDGPTASRHSQQRGGAHRSTALAQAVTSQDCTLVFGGKVKLVRCGYYHTVAVTEDGHAWGFGRNDYGQLGLGHQKQRVNAPAQVQHLDHERVTTVSAGCYHTVLVAHSGAVLVCGRNNHGQIGTRSPSARHFFEEDSKRDFGKGKAKRPGSLRGSLSLSLSLECVCAISLSLSLSSLGKVKALRVTLERVCDYSLERSFPKTSGEMLSGNSLSLSRELSIESIDSVVSKNENVDSRVCL